MAEGHFAPGSMKPKIEACIRFLEQKQRSPPSPTLIVRG
jgi:carbamate kinase